MAKRATKKAAPPETQEKPAKPRPSLDQAKEAQKAAIEARFAEADAKGDPSLTKADHAAADFQASRVSGGGF